jgi:Holliday junction resolvase YEN1
MGLLQGGFLLFALLLGGDYDHGIEGCGPATALGLAKCGFGEQIWEALTDHHCHKLSDKAWNRFLNQWRAEIQHELTDNLSGALRSRNTKLALSFPETFPNPDILRLYFSPLVSESFPNASTWYELQEPMIFNIAKFCSDKFCWSAEKTREKFTSSLWEGVFLRLLYFVRFFYIILT